MSGKQTDSNFMGNSVYFHGLCSVIPEQNSLKYTETVLTNNSWLLRIWYSISWQQLSSQAEDVPWWTLFLSKLIIMAKVLFQRLCALSFLLITSMSGASDGLIRNRCNKEEMNVLLWKVTLYEKSWWQHPAWIEQFTQAGWQTISSWNCSSMAWDFNAHISFSYIFFVVISKILSTPRLRSFSFTNVNLKNCQTISNSSHYAAARCVFFFFYRLCSPSRLDLRPCSFFIHCFTHYLLSIYHLKKKKMRFHVCWLEIINMTTWVLYWFLFTTFQSVSKTLNRLEPSYLSGLVCPGQIGQQNSSY